MSFKFINGGLIFSLLTLLLTSCGGDDGDSSGATAPPTTNITVSDPYVSGAVFYHDKNNNALPDSDEPQSSRTDVNGHASFSTLLPDGAIIRQKISGTSGGLPYPGGLSAKIISTHVDAASVVITPLTTLLSLCTLGETPEKLLEAIKAAAPPTYDELTVEDLYKDPMVFENKTLLQGNLSAANSIWAQLKEQMLDDLPNECSSPTASARTIDDTEIKDKFKTNTGIYQDVLADYDSDKQKAAKRGATFSNFIVKYTNDSIKDSTKRGEAISVVDGALDNTSETAAALQPNGDGFKADKISVGKWLAAGDYFSVGIRFSSGQRDLRNTVGNYATPFSDLELGFFNFKNTDTGLNLLGLNNDNEDFSETFTSSLANGINTVTQVYIPKDGRKPEEVKYYNFDDGWKKYPLYVNNWESIEDVRFAEITASNSSGSFTINSLYAETNETIKYYGVNVDPASPTNTDLFKVDHSRTNNCLTRAATNTVGLIWEMDYECQGETGNDYIKFDAAPEKNKGFMDTSFIEVSKGVNAGIKPPKEIVIEIDSPFCYDASPTYVSSPDCNTPKTDPMTATFTIAVPTQELRPIFDRQENYQDFRLEGRSEVKSTNGLFLGVPPDCESYPTSDNHCFDLKVWAIDSIKINGVTSNIAQKSGFYRDGILFLDLNLNTYNQPPNNLFYYDKILLNTLTGIGYAVRTQGGRTLMVNDQEIFWYSEVAKIKIIKIVNE